MDEIFEKNLISTKDAGELSGYSSDYLARLARSGKINGKRIGHSWLIDKDSLARFLDQQGNRKIDYARALARAREAEYREQHSLLHTVKELASTPINVPLTNIVENSLRSQTLALVVALVVVVFGAFVAHAAVLSQFANRAIDLTHEVAFGFNATFGNIPSDIASKIDATSASMNTFSPRVAARTMRSSARMASSLLAHPNLSSLRIVLHRNNATHFVAFAPITPMSNIISPQTVFTIADVQSFALTAYSFITTPSHIVPTLAEAYVAVGSNAYTAVVASFAAYQSLIEKFGIKSLALAANTRDLLATTPHLISEMNLAFGNAIIETTHTAIRADVTASYGISVAVPAVGHTTLALIIGTGDALAGVTAQTTIQTPATVALALRNFNQAGPALAQSLFGVEYAGASRFVAFNNFVGGNYMLALHSLGEVGYESVVTTRSLAIGLRAFSKTEPAAIEDAYLGALGKSALALQNFVEGVPALRKIGEAGLAATAPVFSTSEQIAVTTYQTINTLFSSTTRAFATLFGPTPTIVMPSGMPKTHFAAVATTTPSSSRVAITNYPTYTTLVQGVSEDFVNQSLASLRNNILSTVSGMVSSQLLYKETQIRRPFNK